MLRLFPSTKYKKQKQKEKRWRALVTEKLIVDECGFNTEKCKFIIACMH